MASSSGMSNLRHRKTVQSTSSSPDAVFGGGRLLPPDAVFDGGRLLPPCRSKKIDNNAKKTQFSVLSSISREKQNAPRLHDSKQIELTTIQRFQPHPKASSSQLVSKAPSSQIASHKCFQPNAPSSQCVLNAPSSQIASISSDAPTIAIIPTKTPRDGSEAFIYQSEMSETSKMDISNIDYWKNHVKRIEKRVMKMKELEDIEDAVLELLSRADASDRRFKEFKDSFKSESPPCLKKVHETLTMFKKEREDMKQCMSELVRRTNLICSRPLPPH